MVRGMADALERRRLGLGAPLLDSKETDLFYEIPGEDTRWTIHFKGGTTSRTREEAAQAA